MIPRPRRHDDQPGSYSDRALAQVARFGKVEVYENLNALPRAWFVRRAAIEPSADVLQIIKTGKMKDGSAFDPAETVLFERRVSAIARPLCRLSPSRRTPK